MSNPWDRNEGKHDVPSSSAPTPPPVIDPDLEFAALRGIAALPAAEPVATVDVPDEIGGEASRDPDAIAADRLRQIVERMEALIGQRHEINDILADVRAFAKACGYVPTALMAVIRARAQDPELRKQFEGVLDTYRHVLGVEGPDYAIRLPPPALPADPPPRRLSASEKRLRDVMAMQCALRATDDFGGVRIDE